MVAVVHVAGGEGVVLPGVGGGHFEGVLRGFVGNSGVNFTDR